jgi:hypothetical protein
MAMFKFTEQNLRQGRIKSAKLNITTKDMGISATDPLLSA